MKHAAHIRLRLTGKEQGGFTLVELLIVIAIIALLLGLAAAALTRARVLVRKSGMQTLYAGLEMGLRMYRNDLGDYPPSGVSVAYTTPPAWARDWSGAHWLTHAMLGLNDETIDGHSGPGFRVRVRGKVYGPYVDVERARVEIRGPSNANVIVDEAGHPILYYRRGYYAFDPTIAQYDPGHNDEMKLPKRSPNDPDPPDIKAYAGVARTDLARREYILCSAGPDGAWGEDVDKDGKLDGYGDDYTNLRPE